MLDKAGLALHRLVAFAPVAADAQNLVADTVDGDDVGVRQAVGDERVVLEIPVDVALIEPVQGILVRIGIGLALDLVLGLADRGRDVDAVTDLHVAVEALRLLGFDPVARLEQDDREARRAVERGGGVGHDDVLGQHVFGGRVAAHRIEIELAEGRAGERQVEQHHVRFGPIAGDLLTRHPVHVGLDALGLPLLIVGDLADDLGLDRASAGEQIAHGLGVEADDALEQHRVERAAGAFPWIGALLVIEAHELETAGVGLAPFGARALILFGQRADVGAGAPKFLFGQQHAEIGVERHLRRIRAGIGLRAVEVNDNAAVLLRHDDGLGRIECVGVRALDPVPLGRGVSHQCVAFS